MGSVLSFPQIAPKLEQINNLFDQKLIDNKQEIGKRLIQLENLVNSSNTRSF